jgi:glutathione S-transferase
VAAFTLVVGNKSYSSWSLRPWLAMRQAGIAFEEIVIPLYQAESKAALLAHSPAGKVPVLKHGERVIWDSLSIVEYLAERCPEAGLWPDDAGSRAMARSVAAEMHSGFQALRSHMPMNLRRSLPGMGRGPGVDDDVERIGAIWRECRERFGTGGPYLFGKPSAADVMYTPVATRFRTYGVGLGAVEAAYVEAVLSLPAFLEWQEAARQEPWIIPEDEVA